IAPKVCSSSSVRGQFATICCPANGQAGEGANETVGDEEGGLGQTAHSVSGIVREAVCRGRIIYSGLRDTSWRPRSLRHRRIGSRSSPQMALLQRDLA
ncbi:unnamed protein product, partial [Protopolystoma xenopodis]